jgi:hypothetical protein
LQSLLVDYITGLRELHTSQAAKDITKKAAAMAGLPSTVFICVGPHGKRHPDKPDVHIITTTKERFQNNNVLDEWAKDAFETRLKGVGGDEHLKLLEYHTKTFYELSRHPKNRPDNLQECIGKGVKETKGQYWIAARRAHAVAWWTVKKNPDCGIFDHLLEEAVALNVGERFELRPRCFKCRALFAYKQCLEVMVAEASFPGSWHVDSPYEAISCAEVTGHFLCNLAAQQTAIAE